MEPYAMHLPVAAKKENAQGAKFSLDVHNEQKSSPTKEKNKKRRK